MVLEARYRATVDTAERKMGLVEKDLAGIRRQLGSLKDKCDNALANCREASGALDQEVLRGRVKALSKGEDRQLACAEASLSRLADAVGEISTGTDRFMEASKTAVTYIGVFKGCLEQAGNPALVPPESRAGYLENLGPGEKLIESSVSNLVRTVDEVCTSICSVAQEASELMLSVATVLARIRASIRCEDSGGNEGRGQPN